MDLDEPDLNYSPRPSGVSFEQKLEALKLRNTQVKELLNHTDFEIFLYKGKCDKLRLRLTNVTTDLESSAKIFYQLGDDSKSAIEITRLALQHIPKTSNVITPEQVKSIKETVFEAVRVQRVKSPLHEKDVPNNSTNQRPSELDKNKNLDIIRKAYVQLTRLPSPVVEKHSNVRTSSKISVGPSLTSASYLQPDSTLTPLKLKTMLSLGLLPTENGDNSALDETTSFQLHTSTPENKVHKFVTVRKKCQINGLTTSSRENISFESRPAGGTGEFRSSKETTPRSSTLREPMPPTNNLNGSSTIGVKKNGEEAGKNKRARRKAKPKLPKEEPLNKKKRKN